MKNFILTISFLTLTLFSSTSYSLINQNLYDSSIKNLKPKFSEENSLKEEFDINEEENQKAIQDIYKPVVSFYVINFLRSIEMDSNTISNQCDTSLETKEKQKNFIKCFNQEKENLSNHVYISSIELSVSFLEKHKKEDIKINFINSFKKELNYVKKTYPQPLYGTIETILVDLFSKILLESFQKNLAIANEYNITKVEIEEYFSTLAADLNRELIHINNTP